MGLFGDDDKKLEHELRLIHEDLEELERGQQQTNRILERILIALTKPRSVASFKISSRGDIMNINPGQSTVLTAQPLDAAGNPTTLPAGDVPNWSVSDASQITAAPSADGLSLNVTVNPGAVPGDVVFTITDSVVPTATGTFTLTIGGGGGGAQPVASFNVTATTPQLSKSNFKR